MLDVLTQHLSAWDLALIAVVTIQSAVIAYLPRATLKAIVLALPIPFTVAVFAIGRPVDATYLLGIANLLVFMLNLRWFYEKLRLPIVLSITLAVCVYCVIGTAVNQVITPEQALQRSVMYPIAAVLLTIYLTWIWRQKPLTEVIYRSTLPVIVKLPIIAAVVVCLVLLKGLLAGFVATFPFVTTVGAYEARKSLGVINAMMPRLATSLSCMILAVSEAQRQLPIAAALAIGWVAYGVSLLVIQCVTKRGRDLPQMNTD